jgi:hypothetical protein
MCADMGTRTDLVPNKQRPLVRGVARDALRRPDEFVERLRVCESEADKIVLRVESLNTLVVRVSLSDEVRLQPLEPLEIPHLGYIATISGDFF